MWRLSNKRVGLIMLVPNKHVEFWIMVSALLFHLGLWTWMWHFPRWHVHSLGPAPSIQDSLRSYFPTFGQLPPQPYFAEFVAVTGRGSLFGSFMPSLSCSCLSDIVWYIVENRLLSCLQQLILVACLLSWNRLAPYLMSKTKPWFLVDFPSHSSWWMMNTIHPNPNVAVFSHDIPIYKLVCNPH